MVGDFVFIAKALILFDIEIVHLFEKLFALKSSHGHQNASGRLIKQLKMKPCIDGNAPVGIGLLSFT